MIQVECPKCHLKLKHTARVCTCGALIDVKIYWVRAYIGPNKRRRYRLGEVSLAMAREFELLQKKNRGKATLTLQTVLYDYGRWLQQSSPRWAKTVIPYLDMALKWFGDRPVEAIKPREVARFQAWLMEDRAPATVDRIHASLRAAVYRAGYTENPFAQVKLLRKPNEVIRYLSEEEEALILRIAQEINPTLYEILVVALATGLRRSNVLQLRKDQVDFERRTITVRQKGGKTLTLPMAPGVMSILKAHSHPGEYFWINPTTGEPYKDFKKSWQRCKHLANIKRPFRWHDLRHHVACKMLFSGATTMLIKEALGHSDIRVTERYAHVKPEALSSLMAKIDPLGPQYGPQQRK